MDVGLHDFIMEKGGINIGRQLLDILGDQRLLAHEFPPAQLSQNQMQK